MTIGPIDQNPADTLFALDSVEDSIHPGDTAISQITLQELPALTPVKAPRATAAAAGEQPSLVRTGLIACGWLAAAAALNVVSYAVLFWGRELFVPDSATRPDGLWGWMQVFLPMGAVALGALCLGIEAWGIGWERSALRRLLHPTTNSARTDLFYTFLVVSGLRSVLTFLFTLGAGFGAGYWLWEWIHASFGVRLLSGASFPVSLAVVTVVNTFTFYWVHRIMHSRFLWEIHKVHHAAEEMNIVTPHRNHPLDHAVVLAVNAFPAAVLGASEIVVLTYVVLNGIYQQMVHTDLDWRLDRFRLGWVEKYLLISSTAHRIHHSRSPRHFNTNFGITPIWDRLFGTYYEPRGEPVQVGLENEPEHNTGQPLRELWRVYCRALRVAGRELRRLLAGSRRGGASREERTA